MRRWIRSYNQGMKILIATKNRGKFGEIVGVLDDIPGVSFEFLGDHSVEDEDFVEDGETHRENAQKKAQYYCEKLGEDFDFVLGEDSGIYVDALADELGLETRRWGAGHDATDEEWLEHFMKVMAERAVMDEERGARFVCHSCLVGGGSGGEDVEKFFDGETLGKITQEPGAEILPGLPLSSVFLADGFDKVYAALGREEKNKISHRGRAIAKLKDFLTNL